MRRLTFMSFAIFALASGIAVAVEAAAEKILAQKNNVIIKEVNDRIKCDGILCPKDTFRCRVIRTPMENGKMMKTNICYSKENLELFKAEKPMKVHEHKQRKYFDISADRQGFTIVNEEVKTGIHVSTRNMSSLQGKSQNYVTGVMNTINEATKAVAHHFKMIKDEEEAKKKKEEAKKNERGAKKNEKEVKKQEKVKNQEHFPKKTLKKRHSIF